MYILHVQFIVDLNNTVVYSSIFTHAYIVNHKNNVASLTSAYIIMSRQTSLKIWINEILPDTHPPITRMSNRDQYRKSLRGVSEF